MELSLAMGAWRKVRADYTTRGAEMCEARGGREDACEGRQEKQTGGDLRTMLVMGSTVIVQIVSSAA
jgi:hypothetical protein